MAIMERKKGNSMSLMPFMVKALGTSACDRNPRVRSLSSDRAFTMEPPGAGSAEGASLMVEVFLWSVPNLGG